MSYIQIIPVPVLCLGQYFFGTLVYPYPNFKGTFTNSGGHTKSIQFLPVKMNTVSMLNFGKFLFVFYIILSSMSMVFAQEGV